MRGRNPGKTSDPSSEALVTDHTAGKSESRLAICLVGPGWRFTSGLSYYTCRVANAIAEHHDVSVIQLRQLMPRSLYPGGGRVGQPRSRMTYAPGVPVYDGIDWWGGRSLVQALSFMRALRPNLLVLQWWTATTVHTYLVLIVAARLLGARVVVEIHELQDTSEASIPLVRHYGHWGLRTVLRLSHGCVVHSQADCQSLDAGYKSRNTRITIAPHGPFDQYHHSIEEGFSEEAAVAAVREAPRPAVANVLFFGLIRPYKGLGDLLSVFSGLSEEEVAGLWLTVVGETWDGCREPARLIQESPHRDRITFVNEYVPDEVVSAAFAHADVVVLPYHRASGSGALHVAMSWGLPIVVSSIDSLQEAASGYDGAIFVPPGDTALLKSAIMQATTQMVGQRFTDPRDWADTVAALISAAGLARGDRPLDDYRPPKPMPCINDWLRNVACFPAVSAIITAFTMDRWDYLREAVAAVQGQTIPVTDMVVVIDHNPDLLARAHRELHGVTVVPNVGARGSAGARNSGAALSHGEILAFLDDDIVAGSIWLETLLRHFTKPQVVGVGGRVDPLWGCSPPAWFPPEFYWVFGVRYLGMPEVAGPVRNVWSGNMAMRRPTFETIGGFRERLGKVNERTRPDDTDLCIRALAAQDQGMWIYEPAGVVSHHVPVKRAKFGYFLYRCFHEGSGKAALAALDGLRQSTSVERSYVRRVLASGVARGLRKAACGDFWAAVRSLAIISGLLAAVAGFLFAGPAAIVRASSGRRGMTGAI